MHFPLGTLVRRWAWAVLLLAALAAFAVLRLSGAPAQLSAARETLTTLPATWQTQMLDAVNAERAKAGLKKVRLCSDLVVVAQSMAEQMAAQDFFDHTTPAGQDLAARLRAAGVKPSAAAENLAAGQSSVAGVMRMLMESPGHRANILTPSMRRVGFGFSQSADSTYGTYWAQDFSAKKGCR